MLRKSNKNIKRCENTFCKKYVAIVKKEKTKKMQNMINMVGMTKLDIKEKRNMIKKIKKSTSVNELKQQCKKIYCNPTCKGSIYENGKKMSNSTKKSIISNLKKTPFIKSNDKSSKLHLDMMQKIKNKLFVGKNTILNNGFYIGINDNDKKKLHKKGAISGCTLVANGKI